MPPNIVNFTWLITDSSIQILGGSEMMSLSGGVFGVVKNKRKENMGVGSGEGAVPPSQNNNIMRITAFMPF